jgi:hypothetical protein
VPIGPRAPCIAEDPAQQLEPRVELKLQRWQWCLAWRLYGSAGRAMAQKQCFYTQHIDGERAFVGRNLSQVELFFELETDSGRYLHPRVTVLADAGNARKPLLRPSLAIDVTCISPAYDSLLI